MSKLKVGLKAAKRVVTSKVGRTILKGQIHSPSILFVAGSAGIVGSGVLVHKRALRFQETVEPFVKNEFEAREVYAEGNNPHYTVKDLNHDLLVIKTRKCVAVAKLYSPALALALLSFGALASGQIILNKRNASLIAAYATLDRMHRQYEARVIEEVGEEKNRELKHGGELQTVDVVDPVTGEISAKEQRAISGMPSGYARFFDESLPSWKPVPELNLIWLRGQQQYWNDVLKSRGHVFLNEIYDCMGIDRTTEGQMVGWVDDNPNGTDGFIDFGLYDGNTQAARDFVNGSEGAILLDFNVDGVVHDLIGKLRKTSSAQTDAKYASKIHPDDVRVATR